MRTFFQKDWWCQVTKYTYVSSKKKGVFDHRREGPFTVVPAAPTVVKVEGKDHWFHLNHCCRGAGKGPLLCLREEEEASTSRQGEPWTSPEPVESDSKSEPDEQLSPAKGTRAQTKRRVAKRSREAVTSDIVPTTPASSPEHETPAASDSTQGEIGAPADSLLNDNETCSRITQIIQDTVGPTKTLFPTIDLAVLVSLDNLPIVSDLALQSLPPDTLLPVPMEPLSRQPTPSTGTDHEGATV